MGILYCFSTTGNARIIKVGMTRQSRLASRMRGYLGPSKPYVVIAHALSAHVEQAEEYLLQLLATSRVVESRKQTLGPEWWEQAPGVDTGACHAALALAVRLCAAAADRPPTPPPSPSLPDPPLPRPLLAPRRDLATPSPLEAYLKAFRAFALARGLNKGDEEEVEAVLEEFEQSPDCPLMVEYLPHSRASRLALATRVARDLPR